MKASFSYASPIDWIPFHLLPCFSPLFSPFFSLCLSSYDRREGCLGQCKSHTHTHTHTQNIKQRERERGLLLRRRCIWKENLLLEIVHIAGLSIEASFSFCQDCSRRRARGVLVQSHAECRLCARGRSRDLGGLPQRWICSLGIDSYRRLIDSAFFSLLARLEDRWFFFFSRVRSLLWLVHCRLSLARV